MTSQANNMAGYYYRLMRTYKDWALHNKRPDNTLPTANCQLPTKNCQL